MTRWHSVVMCAAAGVALTLVSVAAQPPQVKRPPDQVFRAAVEMVPLSVTVTDQKQHHLTDLESKDFVVFEDGAKQDITYFNRTTLPIALSLLIDTSASM